MSVMEYRAAHGIRVGHFVRGQDDQGNDRWLKVVAISDDRGFGFIEITVKDGRTERYSVMEDAQILTRPFHSDDVRLARITLMDNKPFCPNTFPHVPHTNAVFTDWQAAESWDCDGGS